VRVVSNVAEAGVCHVPHLLLRAQPPEGEAAANDPRGAAKESNLHWHIRARAGIVAQ
jgi:hypothetical protein